MVTACWSLGMVLGSIIGGLLANPCDLYPEIFGQAHIFAAYPYLLPNLGTVIHLYHSVAFCPSVNVFCLQFSPFMLSLLIIISYSAFGHRGRDFGGNIFTRNVA